jgi:hypothetical protein
MLAGAQPLGAAPPRVPQVLVVRQQGGTARELRMGERVVVNPTDRVHVADCQLAGLRIDEFLQTPTGGATVLCSATRQIEKLDGYRCKGPLPPGLPPGRVYYEISPDFVFGTVSR